MIATHTAILLTLLVLLVAPIAIILARGSQNVREGVSFVSAIISFLLIVSMVPAVLNKSIEPITLFTILPGDNHGF